MVTTDMAERPVDVLPAGHATQTTTAEIPIGRIFCANVSLYSLTISVIAKLNGNKPLLE
jgi:hypothetical protein